MTLSLEAPRSGTQTEFVSQTLSTFTGSLR
jgi:hypothetical protein